MRGEHVWAVVPSEDDIRNLRIHLQLSKYRQQPSRSILHVRVDPVFVPQPSPSSSIPGVSGSSGAGLSTASTASTGTGIRPSVSSSTGASARASVRTVTTSILSTYTTTAYATQTLTQTESAQAITITQVSTEPGKFAAPFPQSLAIASVWMGCLMQLPAFDA
jgi:hypothetical protein